MTNQHDSSTKFNYAHFPNPIAENLRRLDNEATRTPVEKAFRALISLSSEEAAQLLTRYNEFYNKRERYKTLSLALAKKENPDD